MKKNILAFVLAVLICITPALAVGWEEGRSPAQPYAGVPEVDLTKKLGYMMFYPKGDVGAAENYRRSLFVYLPRTDVYAGDGTFYLISELRGEELRFKFDDEQYVNCRPMTEAELDSLLWGEGTCFEITLPWSLNLNEGYFVNLGGNCIKADHRVSNTVVGGDSTWAFRTDAEYGISSLEYRRIIAPVEPTAEATEQPDAQAEPEAEVEIEYEGGIVKPLPGDEVEFDLLLGGDAAAAVLYCYDDSMQFAQEMISESCVITAKVLSENPRWGVVFLDAQGNTIDVISAS